MLAHIRVFDDNETGTVAIPRPIMELLNISDGEPVNVFVQDEKIIIQAAKKKDRSLEEILDGWEGNFHSEFDWGPDVGKEVVWQ